MPDRETPVAPTGESQENPASAEDSAGSSAWAARREQRHPRAFARRLAVAFSAVAAVTVALAAAVMSVAWNYQFERYVHDGLSRSAKTYAAYVAEQYPYSQLSLVTFLRIPAFDPTGSVDVQVLDTKGTIVYDEAAMRTLAQRSYKDYHGAYSPNIELPPVMLQPTGQVVTAPIMVSGKQVGSVRVWAQGTQALLTQRDVQFRQGSLWGLALAALVALVFSTVAGFLYASRLVRPIEQITATAQALQSGDHFARTGLNSDDEIGFLGKTFDEMADSIEADRDMERRLTADVAHELRTPLQAIQATAEAMQDGVLPANEEQLGIVRDETRRLARLADGILELTRLERGSVQFDTQRIEVSSPVRAAVDSLEALFESCELTLASDLAEGIYVQGDRDRLQQAVGNLLSNAARYTPAGGDVDVRLRQEGDSAVVEVTDTGIGIAEEDLSRVFARFWRADDARTKTSGGLGIGLAVTKEIVERHKGTISAHSRTDGESGATFTIRLPLA
jgi:signal transduction histidine kinase